MIAQFSDRHLLRQQRMSVDISGRTGSVDGCDVEKADPPLLIGGLIQQSANKDIYISLSNIGFDWLTITVPKQTGEVLEQKTGFTELGYPMQGFGHTEKRVCMGGNCIRRTMPSSPSPRWGGLYESWVFSGASSSWAIDYLHDHDCRPSRIDIAFDYSVDDDFYPSQVESLILNHCEQKGITLSHAGPRDSYTLYVGSRTSDRMIRVYRRDLKDPCFSFEGGAVLRVELELKGAIAHAIWRVMSEDYGNGYAIASTHILEMTGYAPWDQVEDLPDVQRVGESVQAAQMVFQFVKQNAIMIEACRACGVDVVGLAHDRLVHMSRMQRSRLEGKLSVLANTEPAEIEHMVRYVMRDREGYTQSCRLKSTRAERVSS